MRNLYHLSTFSGIGGLDLAAERAGFCTVGQCEWADYPTKILEKHWPTIPRWRDIRTLTGESFYERTGMRTVDVISGGFPCQPFSTAGKRRGAEDDRYLWPELLRVIQEIRPAWFVGENVAGIVTMALDTVLSDLENIGYTAQPFIVPACAVDAPHRRDRCAIVAYSKEQGNGGGYQYSQGRHDRPVLTLTGAARLWPTPKARDWRTASGREKRVSPDLNVAVKLFPTPKATDYKGSGPRGSKSAEHDLKKGNLKGAVMYATEKDGQLNPEWVEWLMGFPIGWTELNV